MKVQALLILSLLTAGSTIEYDTEIASAISRVSPDSIKHLIASLSGEIPVSIEGEPDSLPCRFAYSPGGLRAALWIKEQLVSSGIAADTFSFIPIEVYDVALFGSGRGYACGWSGGWHGYMHGLFYTENSGRSWEFVEEVEIDRIRSIALHSADSIWLVSSRGRIIRKASGSWKVTGYSGPGLYDLAWVDNLEGWSAGDSGIVIHTTDAWEGFTKNYPVDDDLRFVDFISENRGWIGSADRLWMTSDGAESWKSLEHPADVIRDIEFTDSLKGYLVGEKDGLGVVYETMDAGLSWIPLIDRLENIPKTIEITDDGELWVAGEKGLLISSADAGQTWEQRQIPSGYTVNAIDFNPDGSCVAAGIKDLFYSTDCTTWQRPDTANLGLMWNVAGYLEGTDSSMVLLTAHYDARSEEEETYTPGADDNASGVACVLEGARVLSGVELKRSLGFVLFAGEEVGLQGSRRFVSEVKYDSITAVLNADMFAYDGDSDDLAEINGNPDDPFAPTLTSIFTDVIDVYEIEGLSINTYISNPRRNSDHYFFWEEGIPALYYGEDRNDRNPFYHQTGDRFFEIDLDYTTAGIRAMVGWAASVADAETIEVITETETKEYNPKVLRVATPIVNRTCILEIQTDAKVRPVVFDAAGRKVAELPAVEASDNTLKVEFDVSGLPSGVYWIGFHTGVNYTSARFVLIK
ncbi:M20/M25/M40 family metallo-hydrolase [candidate division WOR-3 bacterium]|uniref:M20/M25/M40 family metallo-hydrolase n=1 Tax=candidate division WOR-3 bacterium TaxID=2052148 RepID=A0A9D5KA98_UNCW3|nr:M20/M25/M40 family metallo-hydrolase [candidate division WOR-3 bacterium]MBD3365213.1 M20/M25/M40 family metallo-hydrolase [candidate division WOR-3 bacterium]